MRDKHAPTTTPEQAREICAGIAYALRPDWTVGPVKRDGDHQPLPYHRTAITHTAGGYSFDVTFDGYGNEGRIEISPNYPKDRDGRELYPSGGSYDPRASAITVAKTTPPDKIAREIVRRFLPGFLPIWQKQIERRDAQNRYADQTEQGVQAIMAQENEPFGHARRSSHGDRSAIWLSHSYAGTVTPQGESVRFEHLSLPLDVALKVLALLRKPLTADEQAEQAAIAHRQADPHCTCNDCIEHHELMTILDEHRRRDQEEQDHPHNPEGRDEVLP